MKLEGSASPKSPFCEQTFALRASLALRLLGVLLRRAREERLLGEERGDLIPPVGVLLVGEKVEPPPPECPARSLIGEYSRRGVRGLRGVEVKASCPLLRKHPQTNVMSLMSVMVVRKPLI